MLCAAVGVVVATGVCPICTSQPGGVYSSFLSIVLCSCLSSVY